VIKLGYKASAEQFGPNELLEFSVEAESSAWTRYGSAIIFSRGATPRPRPFRSLGWVLSALERKRSSWAPAC